MNPGTSGLVDSVNGMSMLNDKRDTVPLSLPRLISASSQTLESAAAQSSSLAAERLPHVLFLIDQLCELGGAERVLLNMARLLPRDQFRCSLATFKVAPEFDMRRHVSCPFYLFPLRRTYDWNAWKMALKLRELIRSAGVDIVHTFFESSDIWGGLVAKLSGCPVLISSRRDMGILRSPKHKLAYRAVRPLFDRVLTVSEEVRAFSLAEDHLDPEKVITVYNGIELEMACEPRQEDVLRRRLQLEDSSPVITTVGHIRRVKGIDNFVQAAAIVRREFPEARFLVAGQVLDPQYFQELQVLTESLQLTESVNFVGAIDPIYPLLRISNIFCLLSRSEGLSNALLEAMACGLPCVATQVGGNKETVEANATGFLVPADDPKLAADRILALLRNPADAKVMGEAGRALVSRKFTAQAMMDHLCRLYHSVLREKR